MSGQEEFNPPRNREGAAAGAQCPLLTPEVRNQLQTCLARAELLVALDLPPDARRCAVRLERAVERLIRSLVSPAQGGKGLGTHGGRPAVHAVDGRAAQSIADVPEHR